MKKSGRLAIFLTLFLSLVAFSCSNLGHPGQTNTIQITIPIPAPRAVGDDQTEYNVTVTLTVNGTPQEKTATGTRAEISRTPFVFNGLPVKSRVRAVCSVYSKDNVPLWVGDSEEIEVREGKNELTITMRQPGVESVTLDKDTLSFVGAGKTGTLTAAVVPWYAADKTVVWASSDPSVATVDQSGVVTSVAGGTATITATAGGKTATCTVTVIENETGVEVELPFNGTEFKLFVNDGSGVTEVISDVTEITKGSAATLAVKYSSGSEWETMPGTHTYRWYIDGVEQSGATTDGFSWDTESVQTGSYNIMCVVDGKYSASRTIVVKYAAL